MIRLAGLAKVMTCWLSSMALTSAWTWHESENRAVKAQLNRRIHFKKIPPAHTRALKISRGGWELDWPHSTPPAAVGFLITRRPVSGLVSGPVDGPKLAASREVRPQWCCASSSSLTVAGAVSGLRNQSATRTDFPFHRVAKGDDGTSSKRCHVSDHETHCQAVCWEFSTVRCWAEQ